MELIAFTLAYSVSILTAAYGMYFLSGAILITCAVVLSIRYFANSGRITDPAVIFTLSWIGGEGISCLKLSFLQDKWEMTTWICFYLAYIVFVTSYKYARKQVLSGRKRENTEKRSQSKNQETKTILILMNCVALVSVLAFLIEVCILDYVPLFMVDTPHAYSYFHVSGLHYFTVSCVLLPSLCVIFIRAAMKCGKKNLIEILNVALCGTIGIVLPILLVSRYQLLFGVMLACMTVFVSNDGKLGIRLNKKTVPAIASFFVIMLALYVFITIQRDHSAEYLNGIFEMKYSEMPIFISQPYIYIANNYDNFNCLVKELPKHTYGLRMLFPVIALTGLKFLKPELVAFPIYVTKEELTTVTLFYDAYYDFGVIGVVLFAGVLGMAAAFLERMAEKGGIGGSESRAMALVFMLIYAQFCIYLALSFFTTWFSNPTTWFNFGITILFGIFVYLREHRYGTI